MKHYSNLIADMLAPYGFIHPDKFVYERLDGQYIGIFLERNRTSPLGCKSFDGEVKFSPLQQEKIFITDLYMMMSPKINYTANSKLAKQFYRRQEPICFEENLQPEDTTACIAIQNYFGPLFNKLSRREDVVEFLTKIGPPTKHLAH